MARIRSLCVYCAASNRVAPEHLEIAEDLGREAARRGIEIVFGAGGVGLMGRLAEGALAEGGYVIGVIPEHLEKRELGHKGISEYIIVPSMHERKRTMFERSDAFCVLPGGIGTLEEAFETIAWRQLGMHDKPIVFLNNRGFWEPLIALFGHLVHEGFLHQDPDKLFLSADSVENVFATLEAAPAARQATDSARL